MGGALLVMGPALYFIFKRSGPVLDTTFDRQWDSIRNPHAPINTQLIVGSSMFGVGWGLCGICPGPGIFNLVSGGKWFYLWMSVFVAGMCLFYAVDSYFPGTFGVGRSTKTLSVGETSSLKSGQSASVQYTQTEPESSKRKLE